MAHGVGEVVSEHGNAMNAIQNGNQQANNQQSTQQNVAHRKNVGVMGSRRIFAAAFKLKVLDSYRNDIDCRGNQRATARKYGIHRRQIQKWLQCEDNLRSSCAEGNATTSVTSTGCCDIPVGSNNGLASLSVTTIANDRNEAATESDSIVATSPTPLLTPSASYTNDNSRIANCNAVPLIGGGTSTGAPIAAPALAVTTSASPALNLSLTRLHGDEENHHRHAAPPPHHPSAPTGTPIRHSAPRASSPPRYLQRANNDRNHPQVPSSSKVAAPLSVVGSYGNIGERDTQQRQREPSQSLNGGRQGTCERQRMSERRDRDASKSPERKYSYHATRTNYEHNDVFVPASISRSTNADGYYRSLESYQKHITFGRNIYNNDVKEIGSTEQTFSAYREKNSSQTGNCVTMEHATTTSLASPSSTSTLIALHATTIKSERTSPDSLASPSGPYEIPGSPESAATVPGPRQHQRPTYARNRDDTTLVCASARKESVAAVNACTVSVAGASVAVRSNDGTSLTHLRIGAESHPSEQRISEKRQRERVPRYEDSVKVEYEERIRGEVKEEVTEGDEQEATFAGASSPIESGMTIVGTIGDETKREISEERTLHEDTRYNRDRTGTILSCPVYQALPRTPSGLSYLGSSSGPVSPNFKDPSSVYCALSSPRAASSSGISTSSSCSDSEIDPLDYSSSSTRNAIGDLSRRRSFSLRFKLDVLDAFHSDAGVAGNQRATARKFGINRRQVQKWLGQESELRGEIALRGGDLRQRLGPVADSNHEIPLAVDLRTSSSTTSSISGMRSDLEIENSSSPLYCCDLGSPSQRFGYYRRGSTIESTLDLGSSRGCNLSCCADNGASMICYQEIAAQRRASSGYPESQGSLNCYSPRDSSENGNETIDVTASISPLKRSASPLNCCYQMVLSPKRMCPETMDRMPAEEEVPLCLVKPKETFETPPRTQIEPVTSTVPTPPAQNLSQPILTTNSKKDAILFKPYLDNPVSKPIDDTAHPNNYNKHGGLSTSSIQCSSLNNNNNCQGICNLNKERNVASQQHDYFLDLSLRLPVSWAPHHGGYTEFPERLRSAFVRYPTSPHYT